MENEYRLFMWFLLAYFKMIERKPENFVNIVLSLRNLKIGNWWLKHSKNSRTSANTFIFAR